MASETTGNDELLSQFMAFTGSSDPAKAASYLEMSGNNVETAVGLYMEHEHSSAGGFGGVSSSNRDSGSASMPPPIGGDFDDIRAPDATRTMRLMDDPIGPMMGMHSDPSFQMMNALMEEQLMQSAFSSPFQPHGGVQASFDAALLRANSGQHEMDEEKDDGDDYVYDVEEDEDEDNDEQGAVPPPPARLHDIFAAPTHLMHTAGGFAGAKTMAKDTRRWLLVNIQRDDEFSCHALNRDVWQNELVDNLIREGFIFWQQMDTNPEGRTYIERYHVNEFPHIGFIDPRTGRLLLRKEGWTQQNPMTVESFAEIAMDFCSRNSFDKPPQAPRPPGGGGAAGQARPAKRTMHEMSEEEQLQAAMAASMEDISVIPDSNSTSAGPIEIDGTSESEDTKPSVVVPDSSSQNDITPSEIDISPQAELLTMILPDEPSTGARVQIRLADGKRIVRTFGPLDPVKFLYAFVAQSSNEAREGKEFVLLGGYPPKDLIVSLDDTIEGTGLAGQAVAMRWK